jgi:hypothetical protein
MRNHNACPLNITIRNIRKYIHHTATYHVWILVRLIPYPWTGAKNIINIWHSAVGTMLSQLRHLDITGSGLKWDCADGSLRQCYPVLAAWAGDYVERVIFPHVLYGSCPMCNVPDGAPMRHSMFQPHDHSRDHPLHMEMLEENTIDTLHTLSVHPIRNKFWQYPLCAVYRL